MSDAVLVTGAGGLVGAAVVEALVRRGTKVVALDRSPPPAEVAAAWSGHPGRTITVTGDVRDSDALAQVIRENAVRRLIHGATVTAGADRDATDPEGIVSVNVLGTISVLRAARATGMGRMLVLSSNAVYGPNAQVGDELDEVATQPDPRTMYAITKFAAERTALRLAELWSLDLRIARLSSIYGRYERDTGLRDTLSPLYQATMAARAGTPVVLPGPGRRDWMYSRDVGSGIAALIDAPALPEPVYHVSTGRPFSVADWCGLLQRRYPGFSWRVAEAGEPATIDYFSFGERRPLAVTKFMRDTQFRPAYDAERALGDWLEWLDRPI
jgi:nucleoside-diphosphate-sugar epimerase